MAHIIWGDIPKLFYQLSGARDLVRDLNSLLQQRVQFLERRPCRLYFRRRHRFVRRGGWN